jgi:diguanylate cyclase (GGDEF)-like protein
MVWVAMGIAALETRESHVVRKSGHGLVRELMRSQRFTLATLATMLLLGLVSAGYLLMVTQPTLERYIAMGNEARSLHQKMLHQDANLRGYLATGDQRFLSEYSRGGQEGELNEAALLSHVDRDDTRGLTDAVLNTVLARAEWQDWADTAAQRAPDAPGLTYFMLQGKRLFDEYDATDTASTGMIIAQRNAAVRTQARTMIVALVGFLAVLVGSAVLAFRRRSWVRTHVVAPVDRLLELIENLRLGDMSLRMAPSGVQELDAIGGALNALAGELDEANRQAVARESRLALLASRFETVVRVGREISGSLSVRYVSASVTHAAADLLGAPATLWVRGGDQAFHATSRSQDPHGVEPPTELLAPPVVATAAADARATTGVGARAYPLVLAGMVVGVLETGVETVDSDTEQVLDALLSTAAAALESATLHSSVRELADMDGLTHLPNRRRFEADIDEEWQRCRRYGRPMSLVMLDLDHFKQLNDTHGHLFGDQVLRGAAEALAGVLREGDTAYRYGGEEFAVLLRETGLEDAHAAAERLRLAVSGVTIPAQGVMVTASAGIAERLGAMAHHTELVAAADQALYEAKHSGRDRVVAAGLG